VDRTLITLAPAERRGILELAPSLCSCGDFLRKIDSKSDMEFCEQLSRNSLKDAWFPGDEDL